MNVTALAGRGDALGTGAKPPAEPVDPAELVGELTEREIEIAEPKVA